MIQSVDSRRMHNLMHSRSDSLSSTSVEAAVSLVREKTNLVFTYVIPADGSLQIVLKLNWHILIHRSMKLLQEALRISLRMGNHRLYQLSSSHPCSMGLAHEDPFSNPLIHLRKAHRLINCLRDGLQFHLRLRQLDRVQLT